MIQTLQTRRPPRLVAWALAALMAGPILTGMTGCGNNNAGGTTTPAATTSSAPAPPPTMNSAAPMGNTMAPASKTKKTGMSTGEKTVIVLAGAALLYYLYRKHQAAQQAQGTMTNGQPQLYRSQNGGVYYRDPKNPQHVVWLTVPNQPVQVPAAEVQQYAPDYQQYQGQSAPAAPSGSSQQSFSEYNSGAAPGG
jgi:hypothetical protein